MTCDQFARWFEGFCEAIEQSPTPEQWQRVKAKIREFVEPPARELPENYLIGPWLLHDDLDPIPTNPNSRSGE